MENYLLWKLLFLLEGDGCQNESRTQPSMPSGRERLMVWSEFLPMKIVSSECSFLVQRMQLSDLELKQLATSFLAKDWSTDALSSLHCTTIFKPQKNKIEAAILQFDDKLTFNYCVLIPYLIFWMRKVERWLVTRNSNPTIKRSLPGGSGWLGTRRCQNVAMNWC